MQNHNYLQKLLASIAKYLSKPRSVRYTRAIQIILLFLTVVIITFTLMFPSFTHFEVNLKPDGPWSVSRNAPEDIIATSDVEFLIQKRYEKAQEDAAQQTPLHFTRDFGALIGSTKTNTEEGELVIPSFNEMLQNDIQNLRICRSAVKRAADVPRCTADKIKRWNSLKKEDWKELLRFSSSNLEKRIGQLVNVIFDNYIVLQKKPKEELFKNFQGPTVHVHDIKQSSSPPVDLAWKNVILTKQLFTDIKLQTELEQLARSTLANTTRMQRKTFFRVSRLYLNKLNAVRFDEKKTLLAQEEARQDIDATEYVFQIKRGEAIVRNSEIITENIYEALQVHQSSRFLEILRSFFAIIMQQIILLIFVFYFMLRVSAKRINDINSNLIIFSVLWCFAITLLFVENLWVGDLQKNEISHFFAAWMPMAAFGILLTLIFGERLGVILMLYMAFLVFIASKYDGNSLVIALTLGLSGLILGTHIERRVHFISVTILVTIISLFLVSISYVYTNRTIFASYDATHIFTENFSSALQASGLAGLSTLAILGVLPVFESIFNIPTRFKLIELADPSNPLLRELFTRAPSTWTHTMMVSALTEKACDKLKLNTVLARTGIYFHDIGKMLNAGFFIENQHLIPKLEHIDKDNPTLAAKVITSHVSDGIKMAQAARLPKEVIAFIPEHHGTSIMSFFYHKALEKNRRRVNKAEFQYAGPKPQSKETAIAMIADSVEAASRSMNTFTTESIDGLIQRIINGKMAENQFDECLLTVADLQVIKDAFKEVLISSFHSRPKYPDKRETLRLEERQTNKKQTTSLPNKKRRVSSKKISKRVKFE